MPAAGWIPVDSPGPWGSPAPRERRAPKLTPTCASQTCHSFCASFRRAPPCHAPAWPARQDCPRRRSRPWWPSCAHGDCSSRRSPTCPATSADRATPCATPPPWGGTTSPSRSGSVTRSLAAWAPAGTSPPSPRCQARRTGHLRTLCAGRGTQPALPVGRGGDRLGIIDDTGAYLTPNQVLVLLYDYLLARKGWTGPTVRNTSATHLLDRVAAAHGQVCYKVPVGFKRISAKMAETGAIIGGEFSGARPCAVTSPARTGSMPAPCWSRRWQPQASGSPSSTPYRGQVRRARHG